MMMMTFDYGTIAQLISKLGKSISYRNGGAGSWDPIQNLYTYDKAKYIVEVL